MKSQESVYYTVNLSFFLYCQRGYARWFLCCVITSNFIFIAIALGREQFTDAEKKKKKHDSCLCCLDKRCGVSSCALKKEKRRNRFKWHKDGFQLHIKEKPLTTELNACPGEVCPKRTDFHLACNCVYRFPCLQTEKSCS